MAPKKGPLESGMALATPKFEWKLWRACATEDQEAAHDNTSDDLSFAGIIKSPEHAQDTDGIVDTEYLFGKTCNGVEVAFFSNSTSDDDTEPFDFEIYAYRNAATDADGSGTTAGGMGKLVYITTATATLLGPALCGTHPTTGATQAGCFWGETIVGTDTWPSGVTINDSGTDRIATLSFDLRGYRYLYINVFNAGGTGEVGALGVIISGY